MIIRVTPRHRRRSVVVSKGEPPAAGAACPLLQPTALTTAKHQQRQIISNNDSTRLRTHRRAVVRHDRKSPIDLQQIVVELSGLDLRSIGSTLSTTSCCPPHVVTGSKLLTHLRLDVEVLPRPISLRNLSAHAGFHAERGPAQLRGQPDHLRHIQHADLPKPQAGVAWGRRGEEGGGGSREVKCLFVK